MSIILKMAIAAILLFSIMDFGLRKSQNIECQHGDTVTCFEHGSWITAAIAGKWN